MKKFVSLAMASILTVATLASCGSNESTEGTTTTEGGESTEILLKVAMTTDSGTIDDKSFNQGTWEGIELYKTEKGNIDTKYIKPAGEAEADYLTAFQDLIDAGYEVIFSPGFKFETAVYKAQDQYPDVKFVILDGAPNDGGTPPTTVINENAESIMFAEHESGFYAGLAAALSSTTGKVGFVGGMEIPAVQKFGWGYVAGVAYANEKYGTNVQVSQYLYSGSFSDVAGGQTIAGQFYDSGCDIVFHAAGGVGVGVINEGKARRSAGENVWVIGVDVDQYNEGVMDDGKSVILTSAMKDLGTASYLTIQEIIDGNFKGGQVVTFDTKNNGVGLPKENPNLSADVMAKYEEVYAQVAAGDFTVPASVEDLEKFLADHGYTTPSGIAY